MRFQKLNPAKWIQTPSGQATEVYTFKIMAEQSNTSDTVSDNSECSCPKGKNGKMSFYPKVAKWSDANCSLMVFLSKSEKQLFDKQITDLLTMGKTPA